MTRPTAATLALVRSTLPVRRVASTPSSARSADFGNVLRSATLPPALTRAARPTQVAVRPMSMLNAPMLVAGGPAPVTRSEIVMNAQRLMSVPYVWGGNSSTGLDCSAFVSKAWVVARHTTDNLSNVAEPISKDELATGDALNLTTGKDPEGDGHIRLFDRWANPEHTRMFVYEETPPRSVHHEIAWDPRYQPMRRVNVIDG